MSNKLKEEDPTKEHCDHKCHNDKGLTVWTERCPICDCLNPRYNPALDKNRKILNNPTIVLKALLYGSKVEHRNEEYRLDDNHTLCVKRTKISSKKNIKSTVWLKVDMGISLEHYIKWAHGFSDDEIALVAANLTLNYQNIR